MKPSRPIGCVIVVVHETISGVLSLLAGIFALWEYGIQGQEPAFLPGTEGSAIVLIGVGAFLVLGTLGVIFLWLARELWFLRELGRLGGAILLGLTIPLGLLSIFIFRGAAFAQIYLGVFAVLNIFSVVYLMVTDRQDPPAARPAAALPTQPIPSSAPVRPARAPASRPHTPPVQPITLRVVGGNDLEGGTEYEVHKASATIGKSEQDNVTISGDPHISRGKIQLTYTDPGWQISDLGASNPLRVNGKEVRNAKLDRGDHVQLGETELEVWY